MLIDEKILCHLHDVDEKSKTLIDVLQVLSVVIHYLSFS